MMFYKRRACTIFFPQIEVLKIARVAAANRATQAVQSSIIVCEGYIPRPFREGLLIRRASLVVTIIALLVSCGETERAALFPVRGTGADLSGFSKEAAAGTIDFSRPEKLEYRFGVGLSIQSPASIEIEYTLVPPAAAKAAYRRLALEADGVSWALPLDLSFMAPQGIDNGDVFHYAIPLAASFSGRFSIALLPEEAGAGSRPQGQEESCRFQIHSLAFKDRWFGFYRDAEGGLAGGMTGHIFISPFVEKGPDDSFTLNLPPGFDAQAGGLLPELVIDLAEGKAAAVETGGLRFEASPFIKRLHIPSGMFPARAASVVISGDRIDSFRLNYAALPPFPVPVTADPGVILAWPRDRWRDSRYEIFRWDRFPALLIIDTADYAVQDRLLKRLAFFVEKAGFRGRLASDAEIAELHGWNAHDYRAEDLARFFEAARAANFPLLPEERELERILLNGGIIRRSTDGIHAGEGGIISISRESTDYLRSLFMAHEGYHGLFFIDEDFRTFSRRRWERLPSGAKRFITSYFDYQRYAINDEYLLINEFMAHILQQPVSQAAQYFGGTIASRIDSSSWRRSVLPQKDAASNSWPELAAVFAAEAEAFSAYVNERWGLAAGRVHLVRVEQP